MRIPRLARLTLVGVVCASLVGFAWGEWARPGVSDGTAGFDKETARYFNLPEGKAQIGVSSVGSRYLTVRWRDRDGRTWTGPQTVYDAGGDQMYDGMRIRVAGPTLALYARFVPMPDPSEDFNGYPSGTGYNVYVVCRDGGCATSRDYDGAIDVVPQVTPDGEHVLLAHRGEQIVSWDGGEIEEHRPTGLPDGDYGEGQTLLAPDGSLRAVRGVPADSGCEFTLLTTEPGKTDFEPAVTHQDTADTREECSTTLESFASDYVVVVGDSKYRPWFATRTGEGWRTASEDPSGQVRYPRISGSKIAGAFDISGFWHWRQVLSTSPDGHSLVVQVHRPGDERWGPPQVVAQAPEGSECIEIVNKPTYTWDEEDPFYVHLTCRYRPVSSAEWVYTYPTAVTDDGTTWQTFVADQSGIRVGRDMVFRGHPTYHWSPGEGLRRVDPGRGDPAPRLEERSLTG